jgi:hypothetical protein
MAYKVEKFPFRANARANNDIEGLAKILSDATGDRLLGAHIIGPQAGAMIAGLALVIELGASAERRRPNLPRPSDAQLSARGVAGGRSAFPALGARAAGQFAHVLRRPRIPARILAI